MRALRCVLRRDSDLWAIYTRGCLQQTLNMSAKAALNMDRDVEAEEPTYVQPARAAPAAKRSKRK